MKNNRLLMVMLIAVLSCLFFVSVPILADGGEEDPWDADGGNSDGSTGAGGDLGGGGYLLLDIYNPTVPGQNSLTGFMFTISYDIANYLFGNRSEGSVPVLAGDRELKRDVTLTRQINFSRAR